MSAPQGTVAPILSELRASCQRCVSRSLPEGGDAEGAAPQRPAVPPLRARSPSERTLLVERLRAQVRTLEGRAGLLDEPSNPLVPRGAAAATPSPGMPSHPKAPAAAPFSSRPSEPRLAREAGSLPWCFGTPSIDQRLPNGGLDPSGLVELKPDSHGDWPALISFAVCLAVRRLVALGDGRDASRPILVCLTQDLIAEHGRLDGNGLGALGLSPERIVLVTARRQADALWALEEGLRSETLALALGTLGAIALTPSRRLGLAAASGQTPALLLTPHRAQPAPAAALRLRLQRRPSAPHIFDLKSPGAPRFGVAIEKCRGFQDFTDDLFFELEWCDVAHRFNLVAGLADRAPEAAHGG